jgi:pimeloyl-ACP methyl ester carboxylesterase
LQRRFEKVDGIRIRYLESNPASIIDSTYSNDNTTTASKSHDLDDGRKKFGDEENQRHVLFIHGLGSTADRWLDIPDALSLCGFHTVAIDLPGFGESDKPEGMDYTIDRFADIIVKFIHKIQTDSIKGNNGHSHKTTIVGHSLGGYIASYLAAENNELVDKLVLIDSSGMLNEPTPILREYLEAAKLPTKGKVRSVFERMCANPWRVPDTLVDDFIMRMSNPTAVHAFESALENSAKTNIRIDRLRLIGKLGIPTLIIWGEKDKVIPTEEHYKIFRDAIRTPNAMVINDTGHAPFIEKPAITTELLRRFLTTVSESRKVS